MEDSFLLRVFGRGRFSSLIFSVLVLGLVITALNIWQLSSLQVPGESILNSFIQLISLTVSILPFSSICFWSRSLMLRMWKYRIMGTGGFRSSVVLAPMVVMGSLKGGGRGFRSFTYRENAEWISSLKISPSTA